MKKILLMSFGIIILLGGCNVKSNNETYDQTTKERAQEAVEQYIKNNYEGIKSVEIVDIYQSPMGGLTVDGTINGGEADFSAGVESNYKVGSVGLSEGFPERKEECKEEECDY
ncbi:MAG: DUF1433 domain-containing protein [Virgibacillus proomii]|jgi:uncharacterized lipoprotein